MKTIVKESSFVLESTGFVTSLSQNLQRDIHVVNMLELVLDNNSKMNLSFKNEDIPNLKNISQRCFPFLSTKRSVNVSIEFPLITEAELLQRSERKKMMDSLRSDIKNMQSHLKELESIESMDKIYGY